MLPIPLAVQIKKSNKCHVQAILRSVHRTALFSWNDVERGGNPHGVMVGFCPTQSKGGDGRLNKVSKGSGPYHCSFSPSDSKLILLLLNQVDLPSLHIWGLGSALAFQNPNRPNHIGPPA